MTAIAYPDCDAKSDNDRYSLEARSPDNGTIRCRNGRKVPREESRRRFQMFQREFRFRLLDQGTGRRFTNVFRGPRVVWERWQPDREDSPVELVVSDDGWSIIRTHGFDPGLVAVAPDGRDVLRVRIIRHEGVPEENQFPDERTFEWRLGHVMDSSAGLYWAGKSRRYFFTLDQRPCFSWRTRWGESLILDLARGMAYADGDAIPQDLAAAADAADREGVVTLLARVSSHWKEVQAWLRGKANRRLRNKSLLEAIRQASSALELAGVYRLRECIPFLREWEAVDCPSMTMRSAAMNGDWSLETQLFRPTVHHTLKLLGEEPQGYPTYHFVDFDEKDTKLRFPLPERLPDRRERVGQVFDLLAAEEVLRLLGSPDFIREWTINRGEPDYQPMEDWEYDFRDPSGWSTFRLRWAEDRANGGSRMVASEEVAPYWIETDDRASQEFWF